MKISLCAGAIALAISSVANAAKIDFDGDGKADLLYRDSQSYEWNMLLVNGSSVTLSELVSGMSTNYSWSFNGAGDFNADGKTDVIIRNSSSGQWYIYNLDNGSIISRGYVPIESAEYIEVQAVADFNNDGYADVLLRNENTGEWTMTLLKNRSVLQEYSPPMSTVQTWSIVGAEDFDANGSSDILIRNSASGAWYIYLYSNTDITSRGYISSMTNDLNYAVRAVADFDGDGASDVLLQHVTNHDWQMVFMNGRTPNNTLSTSVTASAEWSFNSADDYDGDGKADIALRNSEGQLMTFFMNGSVINSQSTVSGVSLSATQDKQNLWPNDVLPVNPITYTGSDDNNAPTSNAGSDRYSFVGDSLTLDGSESSDSDGDNLTYQWTISSAPSGSATSISNASTASVSFAPDKAGTYLIDLSVNDGKANASDQVQITVADWMVNTSTQSIHIDNGPLVNVQSLSGSNANGLEFVTVDSTGVPDYSVTLTQTDINTLNSRPKASDDFRQGATSANAGETIEFGQDIGYRRVGCGDYWPPGPACPSDQQNQRKLPLEPAPASSTCSTDVNAIGIMLNGTSVFNWSDGASYNNQKVWNNLAPVFEQYDVDICQGHAQQQGNYHHHMYSACVQDMLGDTGSAHSPLYGFAADGYPIYGPYVSKDTLAKPSWVKRDYSANSESGCGTNGQRSCVLVDQYDLSKGTKPAASGPTTSDSETSHSGNSIATVSGVYFEDFYWDSALSASGGAYLDQHNGHEHDALGYHYHVTAEQGESNLEPVFPYQVGPKFYGEIPEQSFFSCKN